MLRVDVQKQLGDFLLSAAFESQGRVTGLFGASGAGKTSLVNMIAGLLRPDRGTISIDGDTLDDTAKGVHVPAYRRHIGYVFQDARLFPHLDVRQNLDYGRRMNRLAEDSAQYKRITDLLDIGHLLDRRPGQLSGGERQRVAILQQLLCGHTYLLMDEPFSSLDPIHKAKACELIVEVSRLDERNTIVIVTHDIPEAVKVCDTLWLLGRERAPSGEPLSGSRIVETYDLIARELAWHADIERTPRFTDFVREVGDRFASL
jgi:molybdate transport system ATP-binding protein